MLVGKVHWLVGLVEGGGWVVVVVDPVAGL
jgi:hypothetical protein